MVLCGIWFETMALNAQRQVLGTFQVVLFALIYCIDLKTRHKARSYTQPALETSIKPIVSL